MDGVMEREPQNRYSTAHDFANDLRNLGAVSVSDRPELRDWKKKRGQQSKKFLVYLLIALVPILIFGLLLYVVRR